MHVLLVEDDAVLRELLADRLSSEGFTVDEAATVAGTERALDGSAYDCLVLDRSLPDGDGVDVVARRSGAPRSPGAAAGPAVLVLTARTAVAERLEGFAAGADDYLTKPFATAELVARVRRLCRNDRTVAPIRSRWGDLVVDRARGSVVRGGIPRPVTTKEFALLEVLIEAGGDVVSREELIERCWDERADLFSNAVYVHVASLRRKLGRPPIIRSVRKVGYALETPAGP